VTLTLLLAFSISAADQSESKIGPAYKDAPELTVKPGVPQGAVHEFKMSGQDSKLFPGVKGGYIRQVCVYIPANYKSGSASPFIVAQDGLNYKKTLLPILDNLIAERKVPPMIAILINSGGGDGKGSER